MSEAKLAPNMPKWMVDHVDKYLSSGGKEGHMYTLTPPNSATLTVPSLLLVTTGRKSGQKFLFPLFYGRAGDSYFVVASKGGAPEHPGWYRNLLANPDVEIQVGTAKMRARPAPPRARSAPGCGRTLPCSGRPTSTTRRRPATARFRSWCSIRCIDSFSSPASLGRCARNRGRRVIGLLTWPMTPRRMRATPPQLRWGGTWPSPSSSFRHASCLSFRQIQ